MIATMKLFPYQYSQKKIVILITVLLLLKIFLWSVLPDTGADGPIYLSHTFSVLHGEPFHNSFLQEYIPVFNFPYLYGFINAPFYFLFTGTSMLGFSIFFWNIIWVVLFIYGCARMLSNDSQMNLKFGLLSFAFVLNLYSYSLRSEVFILPFFVLLYACLEKAVVKHKTVSLFLGVPLLITIIGLMHPVAGVLACVFTFLYLLDKKVGFAKIVLLFAANGVLVALMYLPVIWIDITAWKQNFLQIGYSERTHSFTDLSPFLKYISYNPVILVISFLVFANAKNIYQEIICWLLFFVVICYFHQSYYYHYLFAFLLWRVKETAISIPPRWIKFSYTMLIMAGAFVVFILPALQLAENLSYSNAYKNINRKIKDNVLAHPNKKVWVPGNYAMQILDKKNVRLHWPYLLDYKETMRKIDTSSVLYVTQQSQMEYINKLPLAQGEHLVIKQIIAPVKGLVTVSRSFKRSESIGLWEVDVFK
jgi:hypothetical protein